MALRIKALPLDQYRAFVTAALLKTLNRALYVVFAVGWL
jgi:hypothetical protein